MFNILKIFVIFVAIPIVLLLLDFLFWFICFKILGYKLPKNNSTYKKKGILVRIFVDFPIQFWLDRFNRIPDEFNEFGVHLFCGEQGSGKTTALVDLLYNKWQKMYPKMKVYTNFDYKYQNRQYFTLEGFS